MLDIRWQMHQPEPRVPVRLELHPRECTPVSEHFDEREIDVLGDGRQVCRPPAKGRRGLMCVADCDGVMIRMCVADCIHWKSYCFEPVE